MASENRFPAYGFSDEFDFADENGNVIHGEIQGINEDGVEIRTDVPYNGQIVQVIPKEDFERMITNLYRNGNMVWSKPGEIDGTPTWEVGSRIEINGHEYRVVSIDEKNGTISLQDENGNSIAWTIDDVNKAISDGRASVIEENNDENKTLTDNQGNPINEDGTLKVEEVKSVDELTDEDFSNPTRNVQLPTLPQNVDAALNAKGKPVIIKKNIFEKNWNAHKFPFEESRTILNAALYNTDLVGQTQPSNKPLHWVAIKIDDKSPIVVLEVNEGKENVEIVGWYTLDERNLSRIKRQATKNGGELVMLSPKDKVESLSTPHKDLSSADKVTEQSSTTQAEAQENAPMPVRTVGKGKNAHKEEDWLATTPERGHDYIFNESGLDAEEANAFVENKADEAKKNLEKVQKNAPKIGTSISEYKAAKAEHDALVAEAQKAVDYWNGVKAEHAKRALEAEKPTENEAAPVAEVAPVADENSGKSSDGNLKPVGKGVFGNIYDQFRGKAKAAIEFLKKLGSGEAVAALHHKEVGEISLVWGNEKAGLKKILRKHPEVVDNLQGILDEMHVVQSSDNRIVLESDTHKAVVSKKLGEKETSQWLLTAYEKKDASGGSSDIVPEPNKGKQNGTAPLQDNLSSESKVTKLRRKYKEVRKKLAELGIFDEDQASGLIGYQPRPNTSSGKMPLSIAKLIKKRVERVLDNPNSTIDDLHHAIRFVMHDGQEVVVPYDCLKVLYDVFEAYKDGKLSKEDFLIFLSHRIFCDLDESNDLYEIFYPQWKSQDNAEASAEGKVQSAETKANDDAASVPAEKSSTASEEGEKGGVTEGEKSSGTDDAVPSGKETNEGSEETDDAVPSGAEIAEGDNKSEIDALLEKLDDPNISPLQRREGLSQLWEQSVMPLVQKLLHAVKNKDADAIKGIQEEISELVKILPAESLYIAAKESQIDDLREKGEDDKAETAQIFVDIAKKEVERREKLLSQESNEDSGHDWNQYKKGDTFVLDSCDTIEEASLSGAKVQFKRLLIDRHGNVVGVVVHETVKGKRGKRYDHDWTIYANEFIRHSELVKPKKGGSKSKTSSKKKGSMLIRVGNGSIHLH